MKVVCHGLSDEFQKQSESDWLKPFYSVRINPTKILKKAGLQNPKPGMKPINGAKSDMSIGMRLKQGQKT